MKKKKKRDAQKKLEMELAEPSEEKVLDGEEKLEDIGEEDINGLSPDAKTPEQSEAGTARLSN